MTDMVASPTGEAYVVGLFVGTMLFSPNVILNAQIRERLSYKNRSNGQLDVGLSNKHLSMELLLKQ